MSVADLSIVDLVTRMGADAREASRVLAASSPAAKNRALELMAVAFDREREAIKRENARDLETARANGLSEPMVDRLRLDDKRIDGIVKAVREIAALADPVGEVESVAIRPNGLRVGRMRAPIGVVGIIFESRPNVTVDAGALCLKSGNACVLRGGSEAIHSNRALAALMVEACEAAGLPAAAIQLVPTTDRAAVGAMLKLDQFIDIIIPRGGKPLIKRIVEESIIPVIKHLDGNCSVYVDEFADFDKALPIVINSKTHRTGVCNAAETLLVHSAVAAEFLPKCLAELQERGVEIRGCERTQRLGRNVVAATEQDWYEEYLALIIAVKVVDSFDEAVDFIARYGSGHTESIVTQDVDRANAFVRRVGSACVHVNCSTRFSDGGEYGLGAEIGISTDKLHARGPMGLRELTTVKWFVFGEGQIRD